MFQSLSEWVSSNPDVPDHIKHLVKVADGVKASGALMLVATGPEDMRISLLIALVVHQRAVDLVSEVMCINL